MFFCSIDQGTVLTDYILELLARIWERFIPNPHQTDKGICTFRKMAWAHQNGSESIFIRIKKSPDSSSPITNLNMTQSPVFQNFSVSNINNLIRLPSYLFAKTAGALKNDKMRPRVYSNFI